MFENCKPCLARSTFQTRWFFFLLKAFRTIVILSYGKRFLTILRVCRKHSQCGFVNVFLKFCLIVKRGLKLAGVRLKVNVQT